MLVMTRAPKWRLEFGNQVDDIPVHSIPNDLWPDQLHVVEVYRNVFYKK